MTTQLVLFGALGIVATAWAFTANRRLFTGGTVGRPSVLEAVYYVVAVATMPRVPKSTSWVVMDGSDLPVAGSSSHPRGVPAVRLDHRPQPSCSHRPAQGPVPETVSRPTDRAH